MMQDNQIKHHMTPESMQTFLQFEKNQKTSEHTLRHLKKTIYDLYNYMNEDKVIYKDILLSWRMYLEDRYASATVLNYIKYMNRYLRYVNCSALCFPKGKAKDITGMTFGYLTAVEPTNKKHRGEIVWRCKCKCGKEVVVPITRLISKNTLSCGCMKKETLQKSNKYFEGTSLTQSLKENVKSNIAKSGYTGVTAKRNKWQAYITYKGKRYSLGCYYDLQDAIDARARAKELVKKDAEALLLFYHELEKK